MQISISNIVKGTVIGSAFTAISRYFTRVTQDSAIYEKPLCVESGINASPILQQASLLIITSGYKGGKAYAEIPTNGNGDLTWTRASDAWRTNADGLIQRVPWNLLQRSEEFDNAIWNKINLSVTANTTTAPNGTTTADKLIENTSAGFHRAVQTISGFVGSVLTYSVYLKASERTWALVWFDGEPAGAYVNLTTGALGTVSSGVTASITNVGDGWFRCIISKTIVSGANVAVYTATGNNGASYTGDGTSGIFIWGAQLVEGSSAQTYFPTTDRLNVPRLSYMYGSCPALLLEPQRTNLAFYSEDFSNAYWVKSAGVTITANNTTAPDGNVTADRFVFSAYGNACSKNFGTTTGTYTHSFWAKGTAGQILNYFDGVGDTAITLTANWVRYTVTRTYTSQTMYVDFNSYGSWNAGTVFIWGAQLEPGAYPTTYIPTTTASATRIADSFSRSNIYTNGLITSSGGTWFVELRGNLAYTRDASGSFFIDSQNGGLGNGFNIRNVGTPNQRFVIVKYVSFASSNLYFTLTDTVKIAIKWNGTTADVFVNGTKQVSGTSFTTTNMDFFGANGNDQPKFIQQMALYPTPLSDTDCTTLTTL